MEFGSAMAPQRLPKYIQNLWKPCKKSAYFIRIIYILGTSENMSRILSNCHVLQLDRKVHSFQKSKMYKITLCGEGLINLFTRVPSLTSINACKWTSGKHNFSVIFLVSSCDIFQYKNTCIFVKKYKNVIVFKSQKSNICPFSPIFYSFLFIH